MIPNQPTKGKISDRPFSQFPIAMSYVPWQCFGTMYEPEKGLCRGTLFKELDLPFAGRRYIR